MVCKTLEPFIKPVPIKNFLGLRHSPMKSNLIYKFKILVSEIVTIPNLIHWPEYLAYTFERLNKTFCIRVLKSRYSRIPNKCDVPNKRDVTK